MTDAASDRLSDEEFRTMIELLARFANTELDQWEAWRIATDCGPVYVEITRALPPDGFDSAFTPIWPLPDRLKP